MNCFQLFIAIILLVFAACATDEGVVEQSSQSALDKADRPDANQTLSELLSCMGKADDEKSRCKKSAIRLKCKLEYLERRLELNQKTFAAKVQELLHGEVELTEYQNLTLASRGDAMAGLKEKLTHLEVLCFFHESTGL